MSPGSVIGRGAVVRGNVRGEGSLEILGRVEGDVNVTGDVVLGESAVVSGNITGVELSIAGTVQGDLRGSQSVLLERGARKVRWCAERCARTASRRSPGPRAAASRSTLLARYLRRFSSSRSS
jgi:hypothetical protein